MNISHNLSHNSCQHLFHWKNQYVSIILPGIYESYISLINNNNILFRLKLLFFKVFGTYMRDDDYIWYEWQGMRLNIARSCNSYLKESQARLSDLFNKTIFNS